MKKKVFFIIESLTIGGTEKSLISLLQEMDYDKYQVDLLMVKKEGDLLDKVPKEVNILEPLLSDDYNKSVSELIKTKRLNVLLNKLLIKFLNKIGNDLVKQDIYSWVVKKRLFRKNGLYDVAISYMHHSSCLLYLSENVDAYRKICYVHLDFGTMNSKANLYKKYFERMNTIVTVGEGQRLSFVKRFPQLDSKTVVIPNIVSKKEIIDLATRFNPFQKNNHEVVIVTVARLQVVKGIDIALDACEILVSKGINIKWYIVGDGKLRKELELKIKEKRLQNHFILVGNQKNPYPYIKYCDIYVQPSRTEARPLAVEEAKILYKPIIVTSYQEAKFQVKEEKTGLITNASSESISDNIYMLTQNDMLREQLSNNLRAESSSTQINKNLFDEMIN
ncbi:glycosyltransferase [Domibacillus sp. A3M-37]|uniref:glycosyltransferase n=1 Tax=Domibacillus sp. A3M-37 TaxID=2962037 RepID=UPI0020B75550|nr:glycosyltransferase [Domibacillus sp. A3M-37]MCP3761398.1 glycosyltransferase [Domibacillus sp. A3M-37]